jgi:aspartate/methionine/tyrosine aminotransferase
VLDSAHSPEAALAGRPDASGADIFEAATYIDWARAATQVRAPTEDPVVLFDNTISEPVDALAEVMRGAFANGVTNRYVSAFAGGNPYTVAALARRYDVEPARILTTSGVTSALSLIARSLAAPGDHVLVERPGFDLLALVARSAGLTVDEFPRPAPDFRIDLAALRARLRRGTRLVMITNLHNPSGAILSPREIAEAAALVAEVGALLVVDEVYADFARDVCPAPAASLAPNIVTVNSLTKVYGLFALKCGWIIAEPDILARIRERVPEGDLGVSKLAHAIAALVLEHPEPFEAHWRRILARTQASLHRHVDVLKAAELIDGAIPPKGSMFFPRIVGVDDTRKLARVLWRDFGLLVAPGEYFGAPGRIRIGFGADSPEFEKGLARLGTALREIRRAAR